MPMRRNPISPNGKQSPAPETLLQIVSVKKYILEVQAGATTEFVLRRNNMISTDDHGCLNTLGKIVGVIALFFLIVVLLGLMFGNHNCGWVLINFGPSYMCH